MSQQINLFNPVFLAQKKYFSTVAMAQALGVVLAAVVAGELVAVRQSRTLEHLLADTTRASEQQREQLVSLGRLYSDQGNSKKLDEDIARVEEQLRKRADLLGQLKTSVGGNVEGFSVYLTALARRATPGVWLTGIEISGQSNDLVLKGRALKSDLVPAYVRALSREPAFAGRSVNSLRVTAKEGPAAAPAGRSAAGGEAVAAAAPVRYLEFDLNIPLGAPTVAASKGAS